MFVCLFGVSLFALCTRYAQSVRKLYFRELSKGNKCNCREIDSLIKAVRAQKVTLRPSPDKINTRSMLGKSMMAKIYIVP